MTVSLDNLIPYTNAGALWIGCHSRFGLFWPWRDLPGVQVVGCIIGTKNHLLCKRLLAPRVHTERGELAAAFPHRVYYPHKVVERTDFGHAALRAEYCYVAPNALRADFAVEGDARLELDILPDLDRDIPHLPRHPWPPQVYPRDTDLVTELKTVAPGLYQGEFEVFFFYGPPDYPSFQGMKRGDRQKVFIAFRLSDSSAAVGFGFTIEQARENAAVAEGGHPDEQADRYQAMYARCPALPKSLSGDTDAERLRLHAIAGLDGTITTGCGGFWGRRKVTLAARYHIVGQWFWDTAFTMLGLREFAPEMARDSALALLANLAPNGAPPLTLTDVTRHGEGQGPLLSYGCWMTHKHAPDTAFLHEVYPGLKRINAYWFHERFAPSGLCSWANGAQTGADNDARWEPCGTTDLTGNVDLAGFESPDLNAMLVVDMRCLANIAEALGLRDEADEWRRRAEEHARLLVDRCYFPDRATFLDVRTDNGEPFTEHLGPLLFLPLWAGVPLPEDQKRRIIEEHMLNPVEFFGSYPFPTLAYNDPLHNPHSYWRGRMWPHVVYWMIEILWENGYRDEAERTAKRVLEIFRTTPFIHECYPCDGYDPYMGLPEYNWSLATCLELLLERYKEPRW